MPQQIRQPSPLGPWTEAENFTIADAYLVMIAAENAGLKYNKAATRRAGLLAMAATRDDGRARSAGAWEMKCCNLSAVMRAAGLPFIQGYKPLGHGQMRPIAAALAVMAIAHGRNDADIAALELIANPKQ
jgi:hypothetical protein